jgi:hypothetical protein
MIWIHGRGTSLIQKVIEARIVFLSNAVDFWRLLYVWRLVLSHKAVNVWMLMWSVLALSHKAVNVCMLMWSVLVLLMASNCAWTRPRASPLQASFFRQLFRRTYDSPKTPAAHFNISKPLCSQTRRWMVSPAQSCTPGASGCPAFLRACHIATHAPAPLFRTCLSSTAKDP